LRADCTPRLNSSGNPLLRVKLGDETVDLGLSRSNILRTSAPPELAESILLLRLKEELKNSGTPKVSDHDVDNDWELLQRVMQERHRKPDATGGSLAAMRSTSP